MTDVILGMGEVGYTIFELLTMRGYICAGIDADTSRNKNYSPGSKVPNPEFLHVCIPGDMSQFESVVLECIDNNRGLEAIMIHSTVKPGTAALLQSKASMPVVSSPARGVHRRFLADMQRYTKFAATDVNLDKSLVSGIEDRFKKVRWMSNTKTVEFAKILTDTTYYGWLINYAQLTKMICNKEEMNYDEMWMFAEEIHKYLGNRPKMYPGIIGGHCVIPNLALVDYGELKTIGEINEMFRESASKSQA